MRVLVITPYLRGTAPGPRSSIELWEKVLQPAGVELDYAAFESPELHQVIYQPGHHVQKAQALLACYGRQIRRVLRSVGDYDAVVVYREAALIGPELIERLAARRCPLILVMDDPLYVPYRSPFNGWLSLLKFVGKVKRVARLSSLVIANSSFHAEYLGKFSSSVIEIPSLVDQEVFVPPEKKSVDSDRVTVGWSGSPSTGSNLEMIQNELASIADHPQVDVRLFGVSTSPVPGVACRIEPWTAESEVPTIGSFDIGLAPVPEHPWNRRKFFLKIVQYMALGVPPVATPIGSNPQVIEHGRSGYLAGRSSEWIEHVLRLVDDPDLRMRLGSRSLELAREKYTLQANAEQIISAFTDLAKRKHP